MKRCFLAFAPLAILLALTSPASAQLSDYNIKATRKLLGQDKSRDGGNTTVRQKEIVYEVNIQNRRFADSPPLELQYRVFYEDTGAGNSGDPKLKSVKGSETVGTIESMRDTSLETKPITLEETQLDSGWYYTSGARNKSKDRVLGYWFRLYDDSGNLVAELMNPSTLDKKATWD